MATLPVTSYYPLTYLPSVYNTEPVTFEPEYIENLISLGVTDYFSPTQFATNPLFAQTADFNQNVGFLQTAIQALDSVLTLIKDFNDINGETEKSLELLSKEINNIIQNTRFDSLNVFEQKISIGDEKLDLTVPIYNPNSFSLEKYTDLILKKYDSLNEALKKLSFELPVYKTDYNPVSFETFFNLYNTGTLLQAYNLSYLTPTVFDFI